MKRIAAPLFALLLLSTAAFAQTTTGHEGHSMQHGTMQHGAMDHDRMFADGMIHHHREGIRMARLATEKAQNAGLRAMAAQMIDDQTKEIADLQSLRGEGPMMAMTEMMKMPGMMSESQMQRDMARLEAATGREFDLAFTEIMARHHEGGVMMAKHELERGTNQGLKELAQHIADKQARERQELLTMNQDLSGDRAMTSASTAAAQEEPPARKRMRKE